MIGLDTSAMIDLFKGDSKIRELLERTREPLASTHLNYLELLFGLDLSNPAHSGEGRYYDEFFTEITSLQLDESSCKKAAEINWLMRRKGKDIGKFDSIISGILLTNGVTKIITGNAKHFEGVPGLSVVPY